MSQEVLQTLAKLSPAGLAKYHTKGLWQAADHLLLLDEYLCLCADREITRLKVSMPPQHGKSTLISHYTPAWWLGVFPRQHVILTSYSDTKAEEWGGKSKQVFESVGEELFGYTISRSTDRKSLWEIEGYDGGVATAGIGGAITGRPGDLIIIDDPIKNQDQARSHSYREMCKEWYKTVIYTRQQPGTVIIILQTRWDEDDLSGWLENQEPGKWTNLNLMGIAEKGDPLGRQPGEALWPERYPIEVLEDIKGVQGPYWFNAMYQGRPSPPEGTLFQDSWFKYFKEDEYHYFLPDGRSFEKSKCYVQSVFDPAATKKKTSKYSVIMTVAVTPEKDILVIAIYRKKIEATEYESAIKQVTDLLSPQYILVEDQSYGTTILQLLKSKYSLKGVKADSSKEVRSMTAQGRYSVGKIFHALSPTGGKPYWIQEYENELLSFPTGEFSDQVDCISYHAINVMQTKKQKPKAVSCRRR